MANWQTPLYTSQVPQAGKSQAVGYQLSKASRGKLRITESLYTLAGTEAAADLIYLALLYPGERLIPSYCKVTCQNPGTTFSVQVGDSVTVNRYSGTLALGGGAQDLFFSSQVGYVSGTTSALYNPADITVPAYSSANPPQPIPPPTTVDQTIVIAKVTAAAALNAGAMILFLLAFVAAGD